jgi:hypothetical protein
VSPAVQTPVPQEKKKNFVWRESKFASKLTITEFKDRFVAIFLLFFYLFYV